MSLVKIQAELKAPKGQFNNFGKYSYRSCEDILEAVKPLLSKYEAYVLLSDEITQVGDRFYIKATATYKDKDSEISTTAYAREALNKKGMDESQITGASSSYARKYALNGLFAIDDNKDADNLNNNADYTAKPVKQTNKQEKLIDHNQLAELNELIDIANQIGGFNYKGFLKYFQISDIGQTPVSKFEPIKKALYQKIEQGNKNGNN